MSGRLIPTLALLLALVCCAWFALAAVQSHDLDAASAIINRSGPLTPALASRASSLISSAGTLNPDREVDLLRGQLAEARGDLPAAQRIFLGVAGAEPQNLQAWIALARASKGAPALFTLSIARIGRLLPPIRSRT